MDQGLDLVNMCRAHALAAGQPLEPLPAGEPTELLMDLYPTATVFNAGNRLRLTVMGADRDNAEEVYDVPPTVRIYRTDEYPSTIMLPIVSSRFV